MTSQPWVQADLEREHVRLVRELIGPLLPKPMSAADHAYWTRSAELRVLRDQHTEERTPHFIAQFSIDPQKLSEALEQANDRRKFPQVFAAYMAGDDGEFARLLRLSMTAYLAEHAEEAADEEAWGIYDDGELP